jgi:hypothetical protein
VDQAVAVLEEELLELLLELLALQIQDQAVEEVLPLVALVALVVQV